MKLYQQVFTRVKRNLRDVILNPRRSSCGPRWKLTLLNVALLGFIGEDLVKLLLVGVRQLGEIDVLLHCDDCDG